MVAPVVAAAGVSALGGLFSGITGGKGAKKAAQIQAQVAREQIAAQQAQFAQTQANISPYVQAGNAALGQQQTLLGLNGAAGQQQAYDLLKASPAFTSLFGTGTDAILQNAAATGGLRGGNTQNSLASFGSQLLAQVIQQQVGNLSNLSAQGANAAAGLASAGQANVNAQAGIMQNSADARAQSSLVGSALLGQGLNGLTGLAQQYLLSRPNATAATPTYTGGWSLLGSSAPGLGGAFNANGLGIAPGTYTGGY